MMKRFQPSQTHNSRVADWLLVSISLIVLSIYLFYTIDFMFFSPYPGIEITGSDSGWQINDSFQPGIDVNDVIVQIGDVTYQAYLENRWLKPFEGLTPGQEVTVVLESAQAVVIEMPEVSSQDIWRRVLFTAWFLPFWLVGTSVLLLIRPRNRTWLLLVIAMYLISIWVTAGTISVWRVAGSRILLGVSEWLLIPVLIHLHVSVPQVLWPRFNKTLWLLYVMGFAGAVAEILQITPYDAPLMGLAVAIVISVSLLVYRAWVIRSPEDKITVQLMLAGIILAFGPGLLFVVFPTIQKTPQTGTLVLTVAYLAIPVLPLLYAYALFKRQLGLLEFRANRLLVMYGFILIYPPLFMLCMLLGNQYISSAALRTVFLLFISIFFIYFSPHVLHKFRQIVNRLAYGTRYTPNEIISVIADRLPSILRKDLFISLLKKEVFKTLLIRESALYVLEDGGFIPWLEIGNVNLPPPSQLELILHYKNIYLPQDAEVLSGPLKWIRLVVPLVAGKKLIGIWLLGKRDPDDFYPVQDIDLLKTIGNQMATVIENIQLYEEMEHYADNLAGEVSARTFDLQSERDKTQAILDTAGEGILYMDREGDILYCNEAVTLITGFPASEIYGKKINFWAADSNPSNFTYENGNEAFKTRWHEELRVTRKDNSVIDLQITITPLNSVSDQALGFVGVISDISKIREAERMKSNLVANVSHELKTPLTNFNLYLSLLRRAKEEKRAQYLDVLEAESNRLSTLIQDLLDLSKLDSSKELEGLVPTNVAAIMEKVIQLNQKRVSREKKRISSRPSDDAPTVSVNPQQIEQVFTNLVTNAISYTPSGGSISVSWGLSFEFDAYPFWVRVADTGYGIAPSELPFIFSRFYRGHAGSQNNIPGTGLGLAICKEIIERHKGVIEVESKLQVGTEFTVRLPVNL